MNFIQTSVLEGKVVNFIQTSVLDLLKMALAILGQMFYNNKMTSQIDLEETSNRGRPKTNIF